MDSSSIIQLLIIIVLILLSAFFSSAETALTTVNRIRLHNLAEEGNKKAALVLKLTNDSPKLLSTILIGNNIVNLSASSLATMLATDILGSKGAGIATGILTLVVLLFGEITPKSLASAHNETISLLYAPIIYALTKLLTPVIFIVNVLSNGFLKIFRLNTVSNSQAITENDLRTIVDFSHEEGVIEREEKAMINNVFDFGDSLAKDIMTPRVDMTSLSIDMTYEEILNVYQEERYTRYPVYNIEKNEIIGILNIKDLFFYMATHDKSSFSLLPLLWEPTYCYEYQKTSLLMSEMKKTSSNFTIVLDEYGKVSGLITLEDLLEEIVGEIRDEYDASEQDAIKKISDFEFEVDGSIKLYDLNDEIGTHIESEDYDSIGGHIIELLDHIPVAGELALEEDITYKVLSIEKNRIERVRIIIDKNYKFQEPSSL
ncbi:MAG: HlyC/CorC family transporter [Firmicutes bacterium]|uniref:HlyC/CorC family transporter n=1 Tax=Candidatus Scybalomonas excrementavium TaxID=2840943 RepID=A0A9D9I1K7_9FIRM|nr:HlyC/CorC family transporter [Candidatus Scybalomonas excrementavium]